MFRNHFALSVLVAHLVITIMSPKMNYAGPRQKGKVHANGVQLYYEIHGEGPNLVLIEGLGVATWLWEQQVPELSKHFATIVYDNRGSGQSDKPEGPYSVGLLADDLAALLDSLGIAKAHIMGASLGGFVAQEFASRYPQKVDRLVLACTSAGGAEHVPMSQEVLAVMFNNEGEPREVVRRKLALAYSEAFMQSQAMEHLIDLRLAEPQPAHAFMAQASAGAAFDFSGKVQKLEVPTLILAADEDLLVPVVNAQNLHEKLSNSKLKVYPGLGHQFFVENPNPVNADIIEFLLAELTSE